jgi:hypothetical protein
MGRNTRNRGAIVLVVFVMIALIGGLGFVGWRILTKSGNEVEQASNTTTETSAEVILTQDDLEAAEKSLDKLNFVDEDGEAAEKQAEL